MKQYDTNGDGIFSASEVVTRMKCVGTRLCVCAFTYDIRSVCMCVCVCVCVRMSIHFCGFCVRIVLFLIIELGVGYDLSSMCVNTL